jgi:curved DNA-binding protein CbpA
MSLPDYYKILQVPVSATTAEIKAAFRTLAKLYHPDRNTGYADEEKFKQIKEAYETLSNPQKRARYDAKRSQATTFGQPRSFQPKKPAQKSYSFTEEEAKRRQYYQQHYKKATASASRPKADPGPPKPSYELKQILISVPIAVALLLLIIRIYEKPVRNTGNEAIPAADTAYKKSDINTAETPYKALSPTKKPDVNSLPVVRLVNRTGYDGIVFLKNDSGPVTQNLFIANNYELYEEHLPPGRYHLYYWLGRQFSYDHYLFGTIMGTFKTTVSIDSSDQFITIEKNKKDTFLINLQNRKRENNAPLKKLFDAKKVKA